jgi:chorismate mutase
MSATHAAGAAARDPAGDPPGDWGEVDQLRSEIDDLDDEILRLIRRRSEVSQRIGAARLAAGGTKIVYNREMAVLRHFGQLGQEGRELALLLLRLGRGRLGR